MEPRWGSGKGREDRPPKYVHKKLPFINGMSWQFGLKRESMCHKSCGNEPETRDLLWGGRDMKTTGHSEAFLSCGSLTGEPQEMAG